MSWRKDLKPQPKKGRFFPVRFSDVVKLVNEHHLIQYDGTRLAIRMKNITGEGEYGLLLIELVPGDHVMVYSLPEDITAKSAEKAVICALNQLSQIQKKNINSPLKYSYYCAYLSNSAQVTITQKDVSRQMPKYRSGSKFSNAFKTKNVRSKEIEMMKINI